MSPAGHDPLEHSVTSERNHYTHVTQALCHCVTRLNGRRLQRHRYVLEERSSPYVAPVVIENSAVVGLAQSVASVHHIAHKSPGLTGTHHQLVSGVLILTVHGHIDVCGGLTWLNYFA